MTDVYIEMTYRHGKALAAYLHLPRGDQDRCASSQELESGIVVDLQQDGRPIGLELTLPGEASLELINRILQRYNLEALSREELAPLLAA